MIELPWPAKQLSPNFRSRSHWPRTNAIKKARSWAFLATKAAQIFPPREGPIKLIVGFYAPDRRARDEDNQLASCKAYFDGIAEALGVNDSRFKVSPVFGEPVKHGRITVQVVEQEARPIGELIAPIMAGIEKRIEKAA